MHKILLTIHNLFNFGEVNQYGIAGWQYTFIDEDDGIIEGTEHLLNFHTHAYNKDGEKHVFDLLSHDAKSNKL